VRTTGVQLLAGAVLALGAFFTARTIRVNREGKSPNGSHEQSTILAAANSTCASAGFTHWNASQETPDVTTNPIMEVLATYVREHARWVEPAPPPPPEKAAKAEPPAPPPADVQAVLNVLGRRNTAHEVEPLVLDLSEVDLRSANLGDAQLAQVILADAHLEHASLFGADLRGALLIRAHLDEATLVEADLRAAILIDADLGKASLWNADLEGALWGKETRFDPDGRAGDRSRGASDCASC
jgi:Pentapeptide repeats (8 copies)